VVTVTGGHDTRVSLAALIATRPGCQPRLIYRAHHARRADKQYRPGLLDGFLAKTGLDLSNPRY
jgi:hypothetical protein